MAPPESATESRRAKSHRAPRAYCKRRREVSCKNVYSPRAPRTLDIRHILCDLSRVRAELAGEFSLAIRRGLIYGSIKERSCCRSGPEHKYGTHEEHRRHDDRRGTFLDLRWRNLCSGFDC